MSLPSPAPRSRPGSLRLYIGLTVFVVALVGFKYSKNSCEAPQGEDTAGVLLQKRLMRSRASDFSKKNMQADVEAEQAARRDKPADATADSKPAAVPPPTPPQSQPLPPAEQPYRAKPLTHLNKSDKKATKKPDVSATKSDNKVPKKLKSLKTPPPPPEEEEGHEGTAEPEVAVPKKEETKKGKTEAKVPTAGVKDNWQYAPVSKEDKFLLTPVLNQQFASALQQGFMRFLKTAALTGRTAVLPLAKFEDPGFRFISGEEHQRKDDKYFEISELIDMKTVVTKQWKCLKTVKASDWRAETDNTVDLFVFVPKKGSACPEEYLSRMYKKAVPLDNVSYAPGGHEEKILDTVRGRVTIKAFTCVKPDIKTLKLKELLAPHKTVMISQVEGDFLRLAYQGICGTSSIALDFPSVSKTFDELADAYLTEKFGDTTSHACVHVRVEKLVRMYVQKHLGATFASNGKGGVYSPQLDSCIQGVLELANSLAKQSKGLFIMHDMQEEFGTVTTHYDGMVDVNMYKKWARWVSQIFSEKLPKDKTVTSYCGSEQHANDAKTNTILKENPRACAMVEAAICMKAKKRMRMGNGSFGGFVTGIPVQRPPNGPDAWGYYYCDKLEEAAAACKKSGKCTTINIRGDEDK